MLEGRDLAAFRGDRLIFEGLSFRIESGAALVLQGENGAGKTTLLRLLAGFVPLAAGALLWQGADALEDLATHGRRIAWLGHQDAVKPGLSVAENLEPWMRSPAAMAREARRARIEAALAAVGLGDSAELPGRMLSAGQRRRVAIARLSLAAAPLWLLDEPTTGLDAASVGRLGGLLATHRAAGGMVIAATHLDLPMPDAERMVLA